MDIDLEYPVQQQPASRETSLAEHAGWKVLTIEDRVDAFNTPNLIEQIEAIIESDTPYLILNLETTSFISISFIKKMSEWAERLKKKTLPMILLKPSEKLKRQIDIFASLEQFHISRNEGELPATAEISTAQ
jgi:anti-anti-sigma regulatory factor